MSRKLTLLAATFVVAATAGAQNFQPGYVAWPQSEGFPTYVTQWKSGKLNMEDENFFISRVKPKERFRNSATQVRQNITAANDKRLIWWVPVGDHSTGCNALPDGRFDSEVFSMWSYITHYGNWTCPHGWVPGVFADVAHKNGVAVSGVASIPFGGITSSWSTSLTSQANLDVTTVAKFLNYHGVDGFGYNSEFSGNSAAVQKIATQHQKVVEYLTEMGNPVAENIWYDGTNWNGSISFDQGLGSHNSGIFGSTDGKGARRASLFFNYNWGSNQVLAKSVTAAGSQNIDPLYLYAGFNMQGNDPGTNNWAYLAQHNISVGLWGAHSNNMLWLSRNSNGSTPAALQRTYLTSTERYFGNGPQNPAIQLPVVNGACNQGRPDFFGMSGLMTAKSTLCWDLADEAFITYFNLGNGAFFNWQGKRQNDNEWYNIGVQDYLPTWRYWWAPSLLQTIVKEGDVALKSTFTWDNAFVGGSCLQIAGTQASEAYLHLFKTKFEVERGDVITVSYKLNKGAAKVTLVLTTEGAEGTAVTDDSLVLFDKTAEADDEEWITKDIELARGTALAAALNGKTIALIALKVEDASGLEMNLGQLAIKRGTAATPAAPEVTLAKVLNWHHKGVDGKLIWNMANDKAADEPCYNLDVKTSMFKLYFQEEGKEPVMTGLTTSWAGLFYSAPAVTDNAKVRFGVAAVAVDHSSDSEIAWSEWLTRGNYTQSDEIAVSKNTLKPNEGFSVYYIDPRHTSSTWTIYHADGTKMSSATGTSIDVPAGYADLGGYDVVLDEGTAAERRFGYFIQISAPENGAVPEIYTTTVNGEEPADEVDLAIGETVELAYTGRAADGAGSRGLALGERLFGVSVQSLGIQAYQSFSVAGWVKLTNLPSGISSFVTVENRAGAWPANNWGFFWSRISDEGKFVYDQVDGCWGMRMGSSADGMRYWNQYPDSKIGLNSWTHFAIVFEYQGNSVRSTFYLNGVKQKMDYWLYSLSSSWKNATGEKGWDHLEQVHGKSGFTDGFDTDTPPFQQDSYPLTNSDWISFGGTASNISAVDGILDDFQVWGKAMTDDEVKASMKGLDAKNLPADVLGFWDFESDPETDFGFKGAGSKTPKAYPYEFASGVNEGTAGKVYYPASYSVGCPFLTGSAYKVETLPVWTAKRATVTSSEGTGEAGKATLSWKKAGEYNVTLTLTNSHGSDSKSFPVFKVGESSLTGIAADEAVRAYSVGSTIFVEVEGTEAYVATVTDTAGRQIASRNVAAGSADRFVKVQLGAAGVYVVNVTTATGASRSVKLLVK